MWWASLDDVHPALAGLLNPVERKRFEATSRADNRHRFLLGAAMSRLVLGEYLGLAPAAVVLQRRCPRCAGPHGKVSVAGEGATGVQLSVTHGGGLVGVAFCRGAEVGLDVEPTNEPVRVDELARRVLAATELAALECLPVAQRQRAFLRYWTRKEAVVKCVGMGMRTPLRRLELTAADQRAAIVAWPDQPAAARAIQLFDLDPAEAHQACLAVLSTAEVAVECRCASELLRRQRQQ